ncbi:alpha/beta hydrolase [Geothrix limicola]|uniref:Alpha/beta hydrolase n=1 Tax=Geothrix limicola TaxID=2927978 RepID=A0ABQ5QF79_9BACT|nr:alpha/beta hydrolase [Geothrix limicola]GLH73495.1 alpha/beta hydrolase [Geothrix limicola]
MSTWILLRGWMRERGHWGAFPGALEEALPGARAVALDLPGNGVHHDRPSPTRPADLVAHLRAELADLGLQPPYQVLALSLGGMVAAAWAEAHPEEMAGCVFVNTSFGNVSAPHRRMRPRAWPLAARFLFVRKPGEREELIFRLTSRLGTPPPGLIETWTAIRQSRPVRLSNAWRQLLAAARLRAPSVLSVPTLLLASAGDGLVDPRCSEALARRWGCPLAVHPWAGHDLPLDDGAWVLERIRQWMEATDPWAPPFLG